MGRFWIFITTFVIFFAILMVVFEVDFFSFRQYLTFVTENARPVSIDSFLATASNFPDFSGGFLDILEDIWNLIAYPVRLVVEFIKIFIDVIYNFSILIGGVFY